MKIFDSSHLFKIPFVFVKRNIDWIGAIVAFILFISFYYGYLLYGLNFDGVYRLNNVIPFINPNAFPYDQAICKLDFWGMDIPIMYKEYISSTQVQLIGRLKIIFFEDYLYGFKTSSVILLVLGFYGNYFILKKYTTWAILFPILLLINPINYPKNLFGSDGQWDVFLLVLSLHLVYQSFKQKKKYYFLLGFFLVCFRTNLAFYTMWQLIPLMGVGVALYWKELQKLKFKTSDYVIISLIPLIANFNYAYYNVTHGFPTLSKFFLKLFNRDVYNEQAIDGKIAPPLINDIFQKLSASIPNFFNNNELFLWNYIILLVIYILLVLYLLNQKKLLDNKVFIIPIIVSLSCLILILISPNTTRASHYSRLSPFLEFSILAIPLIVKRLRLSRILNIAAWAFFWAYFFLALFTSVEITNRAKENKGTEFYSPAIFTLSDYFISNGVDHNSIIYTEWGLHSQMYFLNRGEVKINKELVFPMRVDDIEVKKQRFVRAIRKYLNNNPDADVLYFPLFANKFLDTKNAIFQVIEETNLSLVETIEFYELSGSVVYELLEVEVGTGDF